MSFWINKIPKDWEYETLDKSVSKIVDNRGKTCPVTDIGIPLIATNCVKEFGLFPVFEKLRFVDRETYDNWFRGHPEPNDILFVNKGTPGRVCVVPDPVPFCIAQDMVSITADEEKFDWKFLFAALRSRFVRSQIEALNVGTSIPHLKKTDFKKIVIPKPILDYQKIVGEIYFSLNAKIELNLQMNKTLEEMAMALYKHWFVDFGPFQDGKFVDSELGMIPEGWEVKAVYSIANFINGAAFKSKDFTESEPSLPVIKIAEIKQGVTKQTKFSNKDVDNKYIISNGDILFPWSGNPHTSLGIHLWDKGKALLNQHIFSVKVQKEKNRCFVFNTLKNLMPRFIRLATHKQTTGLGHVTVANLKELLIPFPTDNVIDKYNSESESILNLIFENQLEVITLTNLRNTLLSKLISGEVRLKEFQKTIEAIL